MASLTPEEYEYAINVDYEKLPNRLRCAVCNKAVVDAMKTECCDTVICGPCSTKLGSTCPVCEYTGTGDITREDKRTRTTLKAHIKGEIQKRSNAAAAAAAAAAAITTIATVAVQESAPVETPVVEQTIEIPQKEKEEQGVESASIVENTVYDAPTGDGEVEDLGDDKSDIEIITERPEQQVQLQPFTQAVDQNQDAQPEQEMGSAPFQPGQMPFDPQQMFNSMGMNGFNPMLAMQSMNMPFPMMPNMMGMGMDPSMMFNGGFAGMNGMASVMNGNMMNNNFGMPSMGEMNDFNPYNQYGNRFDNRPFHSNRGRGFGQDFRGRGRGRGRGGWHHHQQQQQQQYQQYHQYGEQNFDHQQEYQQDNNASDYVDNANQDHTHEQHEQDGDDSYGKGIHETHDGPIADATDNTASASASAAAVAIDDRDADVPARQLSHEDSRQFDTDQHVQLAAPPVNAPTGPRAMREGLPNNGRYSRPQIQQEVPRPVSRDQAPPANAPKGPSAQRRIDETRDEAEADRRESAARSRSPRSSSKRQRSRSPRKDYDDSDRYAEDKRRRKRDRSDRDYDKKRSRSRTPDDRRHRHRDEKDRRRDRSRDKRRDRDDDDYDRRKSKHRSRREDKYEDDDHQSSTRAQAAVEDAQGEIGFKIKGTSSGKNATARGDPYAEERERMKEQRLQRDAERRQTASGKRSRDDNGEEYSGRKRRSRPKAKYEDEIGDHEQERERNRWR